MALIITLVNVSQLAPFSDYRYEVIVGDGSEEGSKTITYGTIVGHQRDAGWQALVQRLLDNETKS